MSSAPVPSSRATLAALPANPRPWTTGRMVNRTVDLILTWHERARQRRRLRTLDDYMLRDIGLSRADVEGESAKPFWRL